MTRSISQKNIVVYADDDLDDLELVQEAFTQYSRDVDLVSFTDGMSALSYLEGLADQESLPCLVILDINMPVLSGRDVLVKIRENALLENTPVVLFTTSSQPQDRSFALRFNAGCVTKPLDVRQMELITSQFIDHCSAEVRDRIRKTTP